MQEGEVGWVCMATEVQNCRKEMGMGMASQRGPAVQEDGGMGMDGQ